MILPTGHDAQFQREIFIEAYSTFSPFEIKWLKTGEILRAVRYIHYAGWIARRREDPAFQQAFPQFGAEDYWGQETRDLMDQLERIVGKADSTATEPELTNKDFFFDM